MKLRCDGVSFRYRDRVVLRHVSATFCLGQLTAVVGPSGSGKTTLLRILAGLESPDSGEVAWEPGGIDPRSNAARDKVGWIPQGRSCLPARSVLHNVMIGGFARGGGWSAARVAAQRALTEVGLEERSAQLSSTLSGGELQRLSLARALIGDWNVLIADEPTASLDMENAARMAELLHRAAKDRLVITATHDPLLMEVADKVVHLREIQLQ